MEFINAKLEITAVSFKQYPKNERPDVAFVGRSNVGKSSIINTILNRKNLARVGSTPGKTREINFYDVNEEFYIVDLPGYGYAKVSKEKKETWKDIIESYLNKRKQIKLFAMLVDIRHDPTSDDLLMYNWIKSRSASCVIIASKADKISKGQYKIKVDNIRKKLMVDQDIQIIPFSAETKLGKEEFKEIIYKSIQTEDMKSEEIQ